MNFKASIAIFREALGDRPLTFSETISASWLILTWLQYCLWTLLGRLLYRALHMGRLPPAEAAAARRDEKRRREAEEKRAAVAAGLGAGGPSGRLRKQDVMAAGVPEDMAMAVCQLAARLAITGNSTLPLSDPLTLLRFVNSRGGDLLQAEEMYRAR